MFQGTPRTATRLVVGALQHTGHQPERAEALRHHVAHDVPVVVLASPHKPPLALLEVRRDSVSVSWYAFLGRRAENRRTVVYMNRAHKTVFTARAGCSEM